MGCIAVVDDDPDFILLVSELLRERGWRVVTCSDETGALRCVEDNKPSLIILDLRMASRYSGFDLLEQLRAHPETEGIPVMVCSAATDDLKARAEWLHQHRVAVLPKPCDVDDLISQVEEILGEAPPDDEPPGHSCSPASDRNGTGNR